jgi:hypothetical protein
MRRWLTCRQWRHSAGKNFKAFFFCCKNLQKLYSLAEHICRYLRICILRPHVCLIVFVAKWFAGAVFQRSCDSDLRLRFCAIKLSMELLWIKECWNVMESRDVVFVCSGCVMLLGRDGPFVLQSPHN